MNKFIQNLFLILLPFYPFWAWSIHLFTDKPIDLFLNIILIPLAFYFIIFINRKLPNYLILLIIFTLYHLGSVYINNTFPPGNKLFFILSDNKILACLIFIVVEYTVFTNNFIKTMNKLILIIVSISLIVSIIQIKFPNFFFNYTMAEEASGYLESNRSFSIYSWSNLNSLGISFPILVSILLNVSKRKKHVIPFLIISGIIVSFLSKARYVMFSIVIVFSQFFLNTKTSVFKKISYVITLILLLVVINIVAIKSGYNINEVVTNRILERDTDMAGAQVRILSLEVFLMVFPEHPWLGVGPETQQNVIDLLEGRAPIIHVGYLSYLYYYGIIGCSILFTAIFYLLRDAWNVGKRKNFWGSFYGLIAFCFANLTFVYFNFSEMGIVIALIYIKYFAYSSNTQMQKTRSKKYVEFPVFNKVNNNLNPI